MGGPRPSSSEAKALRNLWNAIKQYEEEVDKQISNAVNKKPGCITSMSYSQNDYKLTTKYKELQVTKENGLVTSVGFADKNQELSQIGDAPSALEIKSISSCETSGGVQVKLDFTEGPSQTVAFGVRDAKGPPGEKGVDEEKPKNWTVDSSPGSSVRYGADGSVVAEAKAARLSGSATGISASITVASVSASAFSLSITGGDFGWDGIYFANKAISTKDRFIHNNDVTSDYELSALDTKVVINRNQLVDVETTSKVVSTALGTLQTESDSLNQA